MKEATEKALKAAVEKANNSTALDAIQLTQAALNLAHVLATLNNIEQLLSKVRTLSPEQIERHKLTAGECPSDSEVLLVSSVRRLLGRGRWIWSS